MSKIKDLVPNSRPREHALEKGISSLSNIELLALILGSGIKEKSVLDLANEILNMSDSIATLFTKDLSYLKSFKGLSNAKALKLLACFELAKRKDEELNELMNFNEYNPKCFYKEFHSLLSNNKKESLYLIGYKNFKRIKKIFLGDGNNASITYSLKHIITIIKDLNIDLFILIHSHLTLNNQPSNNDLISTYELSEECKNLNIIFLDHIIISSNNYFSFKANKLL